MLGEEAVILKENESFLVEGAVPHSVWNNRRETTVMVGISVKKGLACANNGYNVK